MDEKMIDKLLSLGVRRLGHKLMEQLRSAYADMRPESIFALAVLAYWKKLEELRILSMKMAMERITDADAKQYLEEFSARYTSAVEQVAQELSIEELQAVILFWENRHAVPARGNETPMTVARLALRLLDVQDGDVLLDLGAGRGIFLREAAFLGKDVRLAALDKDRSMCRILQFCSGSMGWGAAIYEDDILVTDLARFGANKIFMDATFEASDSGIDEVRQRLSSNPIFRDFHGQDTPKKLATEWWHIVAALAGHHEGRMVALIRDRSELISAETEIFRQKLIQEGRIEAVIALSGELDYVRLPLYLIVFSQNNTSVRLVDAREIYTSSDEETSKKRVSLGFHPARTLKAKDMDAIFQALEKDSSNSRCFSCEEMAGRGYRLLPDAEFLNNDEYCMSMSDLPMIQDICQIYRGDIAANAKALEGSFSETPTDCQYLQLKDVQDGIISGPLKYLKEIDEKKSQFCANNGVLIMGKNAPVRIGLLEVSEDAKVLLSGNIYAMKVDEGKCDSVYLMLYLQSEDGMRQLEHILRGKTAVQTIGLQDLKKVKIPMIPLEEQHEIAKKYRELHAELQEVLGKAEQIRGSIKQLVVQNSE